MTLKELKAKLYDFNIPERWYSIDDGLKPDAYILYNRYDNISQTKEEFEYDAIDRLTKSAALDMKGGGIMHLPIETAYQNGFWGSFGQIASKSDVGTYSYSGFPRNAVKSLSDPASIISHKLQKIEYNQFHKARIITEDIGATEYEEKFIYDADEDRAYSQQTQGAAPTGTLVRQRWYDGDLEIIRLLSILNFYTKRVI